MNPADAALKPYLTYSLTLHLALLAAALLFLRSSSTQSSPVYTIDFVGPTAGIIGRTPEGPSQPARSSQAVERRVETEELTVPRRKRLKLPKPSLLSNATPAPEPKEDRAPEPSTAPKEAADAPPGDAEASQAISGAPGSGGITTDLPNFPYPWYISQVRSALWNHWSTRMPNEAGMAVVVFTIMPDGAVVDIRAEESSGDPNFDLSAMGAAQDSGPFPPLPAGFQEPFLKVHVTLKSGK